MKKTGIQQSQGVLVHGSLFVIVSAVQLSSLKTETERIQAQKEQLQAELLACRTELEAQRVALSHVQNTSKALSNDKVSPAYSFSKRLNVVTVDAYKVNCLSQELSFK